MTVSEVSRGRKVEREGILKTRRERLNEFGEPKLIKRYIISLVNFEDLFRSIVKNVRFP